MVGSWDWKAVHLYFTTYYNITSFPLKWNEKSKLFSFDFKNPMKYYAWFLNFYFVFGIGSLSSLAYDCLIKEGVPPFLILSYVVGIFLVLADLGLSLFLLAYGYETVNSMNSLVLIQRELMSWQRQKKGNEALSSPVTFKWSC